MIPLRDLQPTTVRPVVTWGIVGLNVLVFALTYADPEHAARLLGAVPYHFTGLEPHAIWDPETGRLVPPVAKNALWPLRIVTHMFTHGGVLHILFNMWFLWVFGDNVEERVGALRYALLYFGAGLVALAAQVASDPASGQPMIGASGAVAGVLGAYLRLFPKARILALVPLGFFFFFVVWPAAVFLGLWIAMQVISGIATYGTQTGGVAWWAHVGGFAFGFLVVRALEPKRRRIEVDFQQQ